MAKGERKMAGRRFWGRVLAIVLLSGVLAPGCYRVHPTQKAENQSGADSAPKVVTGAKLDGVHSLPPEQLIHSVAAGWAWDPSQPDTPISVDIYDDDKLIATILADKFSEALVKEEIGNGKHAFVYFYPPSLSDGKEHTIRICVAGTDIGLRQTPRKVVISAPAKANKEEVKSKK
jgi:hypothetical protein